MVPNFAVGLTQWNHPLQNPSCGFQDRGKIEEDQANYVFFGEPFLGNFRDAGV